MRDHSMAAPERQSTPEKALVSGRFGSQFRLIRQFPRAAQSRLPRRVNRRRESEDPPAFSAE
jgi:hypothetical protein